MLTLADIPLIVPSRGERFSDLERDVAETIPVERTCPWLASRSWPGPGLSQIAFPTGVEPPRAPMLQVFRWPAWGACRFAHGWFLASTNQVNQLQQVAFQGGPGGKPLPVPLAMDSPGQRSAEALTTNVYILAMTPLLRVLPGESDADPYVNGLYVLTLVDERFFWWGIPSPVFNILANTAPPITPPPPPAPVQWTDLIRLCSTALGESISADAIPGVYLVPSTALNANYEVIPPVLDAIASNIGMRFVRSLTGSLSFQSTATASSILSSDRANNPLRTIRGGSARFETQL
jgi:hypothetical protein